MPVLKTNTVKILKNIEKIFPLKNFCQWHYFNNKNVDLIIYKMKLSIRQILKLYIISITHTFCLYYKNLFFKFKKSPAFLSFWIIKKLFKKD